MYRKLTASVNSRLLIFRALLFHFRKLLAIMKIAFVLVIAFSLSASASSRAQNVPVSIKVRNASIQEVFSKLTKQTGYNFLCDAATVKGISVTLNVVNINLKDALSRFLDPQQFEIVFGDDKTVIIKPREQDRLFVQQPDIIITGRVTNNKNAPLAGATVAVKGTQAATSTDAAGNFKIPVANKEAILVVSFVGFTNKEVPVKNSTDLHIVLQEANREIEQVVVVGYGSQSKAKLTGAAATVKIDELLGDRPVSSLGAVLQGATPGLQVSIGSGQPGANISWNIRGGTDYGKDANNNTVMNSGGPLIIVDNVPYNGPTNLLDPNDIESVTVLKDPASASIYGSRTAYGVVVITTKSGKKNQKVQFNYSNNIVFATPTNLPEKATPIQQVQAWIDGGMTGSYNGNQNLTQWMTLLKDYQANPGKYPMGGDTLNGVYYQLAPTDAVNTLLGNHSTQIMNNFSVSGGSDKTTYRMSFGSTNENGILASSANQDSYKRYNVKSLVTTDVNSWLNLQLDAGYNNSTGKTPFYPNVFGDATNTPSALPLDSIPTKPGQVIRTGKNELLARAPITTNTDEIRATGRTIIKPVKGLTITGEYTIDNTNTDITQYDKKVTVPMLNPYGYTPEGFGNDVYDKSHGWNKNTIINIFGNYALSLNHQHNFTLLAGFNQEQRNTGTDEVAVSGLVSPDLPFLAGTTGLNVPTISTKNYAEFASRGYFARLNYDFRSKYLFQISYRYDGSSKFPEGHRWVGLPGASVGWRITEEKFMHSLRPYLNELKLRASYGSVANQNIADYGFFPGMNIATPNWLNNSTKVATLLPPPLTSANFTWETVSSADLGLDWAMLKNRFTGTFDWYQRDTKDILTDAANVPPAVLGTGLPLQNSGSLRTKGFELQLNWKDQIGKVGYNVGVSLFNYTSVVTKCSNTQNIYFNNAYQVYEGKKMGEIWGYVTDRFYDTTDFKAGTLNSNLRGGTLLPGVAKQNGQSPNPGDILYKDLNGDSVITTGAYTLANHGDLTIIGNSTPQYQYAITGGVSYANFDFSFIMNGVAKQEGFLAGTLAYPNQWVTYGALYSHQLNYWTPANKDAYYARIYTDNVNAGQTLQGYNQQAQTRYLRNKSYLRLRNITLRYTVPSASLVMQKLHINKFQVFASMENVTTFSHLPKGIDPDLSVQGSGVGGGIGYPFMRKTSVGINVSF
ncbi:SusC/RagA family TonB-linked outer membrane protein [Chitinophagaceae bacterium 26-R-25]|nr:SusC/RagA family TonB-linked outer membrane protein [Chitinophagaceae bacterium 26-R-25]